MANAAWAQSDDVTNKELPKGTQRTGVLSSSSTAKAPLNSDTSPRNILVRNTPYRPLAAQSQNSGESKKPDHSSVIQSQTSVEPQKPVLRSKQTENSPKSDSRSSACRLGGYVEENMGPEECRRQGGMMIAVSKTSARSNRPAPQSKQAENSSAFDWRNSVCRVRGHEKGNLSPEECRKQGGVMITTGDVPTYHKPPANGKFVGGK